MIEYGLRQRVATVLSVLFFVVILAGCTAPLPPVQPVHEPLEIKTEPPSPRLPVSKAPLFFKHRVRWPGETLSQVAKWYTGSKKNWQQIARENPTLAPDHLVIGDTISIPMDLMTSRRPMPRSYVHPPTPARKPSPVIPPEPSPPPSLATSLSLPPAPTLFGPIDDTPPGSGSDETELFPPME